MLRTITIVMTILSLTFAGSAAAAPPEDARANPFRYPLDVRPDLDESQATIETVVSAFSQQKRRRRYETGAAQIARPESC
jgi:hypothetical protein